jgi:hypothetical protein
MTINRSPTARTAPPNFQYVESSAIVEVGLTTNQHVQAQVQTKIA